MLLVDEWLKIYWTILKKSIKGMLLLSAISKLFKTYKNEFQKKQTNGFWTFNQNIRWWDVCDRDFSNRNDVFELKPIETVNFGQISKLPYDIKTSRKAFELLLH